MRVRARITDPAPGADPPACTPSAARPGPVRSGHPGGDQLHRRGRLAARRPTAAERPAPVAGMVVRLELADVGRHTVRARATDAAGNTQPEVPPWNRLGYGNNAIEVAFVDVE